MNKLSFRFRIFLMMLALGLAAVPFFNTLFESKKSEIPFSLPQVHSDSPIYVIPALPTEKITQNRDMSLYDLGGSFTVCSGFNKSKDLNCAANTVEVRKFIWEHWQAKKRGYIIFEELEDRLNTTNHIFIEPVENGQWKLIQRKVEWGSPPFDRRINSIKWENCCTKEANYKTKHQELLLNREGTEYFNDWYF